MTSATDLRFRSRAHALSQAASLIAILTGGMVLSGWMFNLVVLKSILTKPVDVDYLKTALLVKLR